MPNISAYISTSVDDCKCSLQHVKDLKFCRDLLAECEKLRGQTSRIKVIKTRISQLEKEGPMKAKHSYKDTRGALWVACCECDRGGNGTDKDKCSSGWRVKKWNYLGCFSGTLRPDLEVAP